jgi:hypothetical protein
MANQRFSPPIHADIAKHSMLNLIPFARPRREMADCGLQPGFVG